jgi:hypothetical protein
VPQAAGRWVVDQPRKRATISFARSVTDLFSGELRKLLPYAGGLLSAGYREEMSLIDSTGGGTNFTKIEKMPLFAGPSYSGAKLEPATFDL